MRNIFLVTLQWPLELCMQSAAFKIERQLPHVTTQKHMHITYADTHMCVSLGLYRFITSYANFFQCDFTVYILQLQATRHLCCGCGAQCGCKISQQPFSATDIS